MPPTATLEDIKAYQQKVEKDKITPHNLPPCPRCSVDSEFFKIHAYRERRFLIIIEMLIKAAYCSLVRFRCPGCGQDLHQLPGFCNPSQTLYAAEHHGIFCQYVESDEMTYQQAVMVDNSAAGISSKRCYSGSINDPPLDYSPGTFYPNLPNSPDPCCFRKIPYQAFAETLPG